MIFGRQTKKRIYNSFIGCLARKNPATLIMLSHQICNRFHPGRKARSSHSAAPFFDVIFFFFLKILLRFAEHLLGQPLGDRGRTGGRDVRQR